MQIKCIFCGRFMRFNPFRGVLKPNDGGRYQTCDICWEDWT